MSDRPGVRPVASVRLRVTLAFVAAAAVLLAVTGGTTYALVAHRLHGDIDRELRSTARELAGPLHASTAVRGHRGLDVHRRNDYLAAGRSAAAVCLSLGSSSPDAIVGAADNAVRPDPSTTIVVRRIDGSPACGPVLAPRAAGGATRSIRVLLPDGATLRLTRSSQAAHDTLRDLARVLAAVALAGLALAFLAGLIAAQVALRSLRAVTAGIGRAVADPTLAARYVGAVPADVNDMVAAFDGLLDQLADLGEVQRRIAIDVAHELRTPVTSVRANIDVLVRLPADHPERADVLRDVQVQLQALSVAIDDAVAIARSRTTTAPQLAEVDLVELANTAAERARALHPGLVVDVVDVAAAATGSLRVDRAMVERALANLLDNAAKFAGVDRPVTIAVGAHALAVRDRGPGLPPGGAERLFTQGVRADRDADVAGSGLGLAMVARVAAAHGGRAFARDLPDGGAEFVVELAPADGSQDPLGMASEQRKEGTAPWGEQPPATTEPDMTPAAPQPADDLTTHAPAEPASLALVHDGDVPESPERAGGHLARLGFLAGVATWVVLLAGTAASAIAWALGVVQDNAGTLTRLDLVLGCASAASLVLFGVFLAGGIATLRRPCNLARRMWALDATIATSGFAGACATLLAFDSIGLGIGPSDTVNQLVPIVALHAIGLAFGLAAAVGFARLHGRLRRVDTLDRTSVALVAGVASVVLTWSVGVVAASADIGGFAVRWTSDPTYVLLSFVAGAATGGLTAILVADAPAGRRRNLLVGGAMTVGVAISVAASVLLGS